MGRRDRKACVRSVTNVRRFLPEYLKSPKFQVAGFCGGRSWLSLVIQHSRLWNTDSSPVLGIRVAVAPNYILYHDRGRAGSRPMRVHRELTVFQGLESIWRSTIASHCYLRECIVRFLKIGLLTHPRWPRHWRLGSCSVTSTRRFNPAMGAGTAR
jgi:hypothetical protein